MTRKATHVFIIGTFVTLYLLVSIISTIHVIDFFLLSNPKWLAISLAIAFEVGAAASLASIITLEKMNRGIVWGLFILLTLMQAMGNTYYTYVHLADFQGWIELFGLVDEELIYQKRVLSIVSGAILPIVALGFIKSLVDYIRPESTENVSSEVSVSSEPSATESAVSEIANETAEIVTVENLVPIEKLPAVEIQQVSEETIDSPKVDNTSPIVKSNSIDETVSRGGRISFNDKL